MEFNNSPIKNNFQTSQTHNVLINLSQFKNIVQKVNQEEGFVTQLGTVLVNKEKFKDVLLEPTPNVDENYIVTNQKGEVFPLVHQYDRIPQFKEFINKKIFMKVVISIFCLPYEIDELENTLNQLRVTSHYIDKSIDWNIDVTMCISDKMVNWDKSSINKKYFQDKFLKLSSHTDWCIKHFQASDTILGCVSQRRYSLERHKDSIILFG